MKDLIEFKKYIKLYDIDDLLDCLEKYVGELANKNGKKEELIKLWEGKVFLTRIEIAERVLSITE